MQKTIFRSGAFIVTLAGSSVLASCASKPPAQITTVNVEVPAAKTGGETGSKTGSKTDDTAAIKEIDESGAIDESATNGSSKSEPAARRNSASAEPTDRDVEDAAPAKKAAAKRASSNRNAVKGESRLMWYYDRVDSEYFTSFGGVNRRSLLQRKGAIVDYKHNFIEIPGSTDERDGDLHKLQITLFPRGNEPWCAVSRIVWPRGKTPGKLGFYNNSADGYGLRKASDDFFPDKLRRVDGAYESAWLPQRGLDINFNSGQDSEFTGFSFHYNTKTSSFSLNDSVEEGL